MPLAAVEEAPAPALAGMVVMKATSLMVVVETKTRMRAEMEHPYPVIGDLCLVLIESPSLVLYCVSSLMPHWSCIHIYL